MRRGASARLVGLVACGAGLLAGAGAANAVTVPVPPPLSADTAAASIDSSYGSGHFGTWATDQWGLPVYDYTDDEMTDPDARQSEVDGSTAAQHQVGNDDIKGLAFNDGDTELWSQELEPQWANLYDPAHRHYGGGYGYLDVDGHVTSTLYLDHQPDELFARQFGVGYYRKAIVFDGVGAAETTYAPFGSDPVLLDDITLTNTTTRTVDTAWYEYWDVNPVDQLVAPETSLTRGLLSPRWDPATQTLSVAQIPTDPRDVPALSIFAAAVRGPAQTFETSVSKFFGAGSRAAPAEVTAGALSESIARANLPGQSGDTLFVFRAPVTLAPGQSVTLRYVYGMAHPAQVPGLVSEYRTAVDPLATSEHEWLAIMPQADFGPQYRWVSRELQWDAYLLRSATVYEDDAGEHTITQGGYYQYGDGLNLGTRSWDHYEWPMVYSDPELAREIILYTIKLQPPGLPQDAQLPYGTGPFSEPVELGTSDDLDFWLLEAAAEYGLATRDMKFFAEQVPYYGGVLSASVWQHLKVAFEHMETYHSGALHGLYLMGVTGDWNDFSTEFEQLTESTLVTAQLAYCYPQLAQLADLYGDHAFAAQLRAAGARDLAAVRAQWTGQGWYSRGYSGLTQVGQGVIFEEPQPWAILAGAPTPAQADTLIANIKRYLDGVGAPGGPTKIGTALVPGADDPGVTEHGPLSAVSLPPSFEELEGEALGMSPLNGADEWPGGVWFDPNGWLTWALASLQGEVPGAVDDAWSEYLRNTLANHATQFPDHWAGTISVDDVCDAYYSPHPEECGNGLSSSFDGEITEQATWMEMDAIDLAGVTPTGDGYDVTPHLPMTTFSLRMPQVGVASAPGLLRGYVTTQADSVLVMHVAVPPAGAGRPLQAFADGVAVMSRVVGSQVVFDLSTRAGVPADWAVEAP
ncbi:MAG TPA: hypothetical protein VL961_01155 [Acidimicrobiales bacterium]|nr:hypothetical protein [Acidimicrobiales bacterium]